MLVLHEKPTIKILHYSVFIQCIRFLANTTIDEALEVRNFFNKVQNHILQFSIHEGFYEEWYSGQVMFLHFHVPKTIKGINVIMCVSNQHEVFIHFLEYTIRHQQKKK
jgi:hypothetical protein